MLKVKIIIETIYICVGLMFFSKEVISSQSEKGKKELESCGVSV